MASYRPVKREDGKTFTMVRWKIHDPGEDPLTDNEVLINELIDRIGRLETRLAEKKLKKT